MHSQIHCAFVVKTIFVQKGARPQRLASGGDQIKMCAATTSLKKIKLPRAATTLWEGSQERINGVFKKTREMTSVDVITIFHKQAHGVAEQQTHQDMDKRGCIESISGPIESFRGQ